MDQLAAGQLAARIATRMAEPVSPWLRGMILDRDRHTCRYCGARATEVDHFFPRAKGGLSVSSNLVAACLACNRSKGQKTYTEWVAWKARMALAVRAAKRVSPQQGRARRRVRRIPAVLR